MQRRCLNRSSIRTYRSQLVKRLLDWQTSSFLLNLHDSPQYILAAASNSGKPRNDTMWQTIVVMRACLPRFRYHQSMSLGWKVLTEVCLAWHVVSCIKELPTLEHVAQFPETIRVLLAQVSLEPGPAEKANTLALVESPQ
jgi:hypothetical protein